jgi:hypothetical protein
LSDTKYIVHLRYLWDTVCEVVHYFLKEEEMSDEEKGSDEEEAALELKLTELGKWFIKAHFQFGMLLTWEEKN